MRSNRLLASIGGVCIAGAAVIGAVLGAQAGGKAPAQRPASNQQQVTGAAATTSPARPAPAVVAAASSSTTMAGAPVHHPKAKRATVNNQEPAVTDPQPQADPSTSYADRPPTHGDHPQNGEPDVPPTGRAGGDSSAGFSTEPTSP